MKTFYVITYNQRRLNKNFKTLNSFFAVESNGYETLTDANKHLFSLFKIYESESPVLRANEKDGEVYYNLEYSNYYDHIENEEDTKQIYITYNIVKISIY